MKYVCIRITYKYYCHLTEVEEILKHELLFRLKIKKKYNHFITRWGSGSN